MLWRFSPKFKDDANNFLCICFMLFDKNKYNTTKIQPTIINYYFHFGKGSALKIILHLLLKRHKEKRRAGVRQVWKFDQATRAIYSRLIKATSHYQREDLCCRNNFIIQCSLGEVVLFAAISTRPFLRPYYKTTISGAHCLSSLCAAPPKRHQHTLVCGLHKTNQAAPQFASRTLFIIDCLHFTPDLP